MRPAGRLLQETRASVQRECCTRAGAGHISEMFESGRDRIYQRLALWSERTGDFKDDDETSSEHEGDIWPELVF